MAFLLGNRREFDSRLFFTAFIEIDYCKAMKVRQLDEDAAS